MMKSALTLSLCLALSVPALGCVGTVASEAGAEVPTTRAPVATTATGTVKLVGEALGEVPLAEGQRAQIEQLAAAAETRRSGEHAARKELTLALADQVERGALDRGALGPRIDALVAAARALQGPDRAAFEQLHALLAPDQRTAFIDAFTARLSGHGAHGVHGSGHPLEQWAIDLSLTDDQKSAIKDALFKSFHDGKHGDGPGAFAGAKQQADALFEAFKQDRFVFDEVAPPKDPASHVTWATGRFLGIAETVLPLLTPAQRGVAAQKLRSYAAAGTDLP